jgi:hypothetical protein
MEALMGALDELDGGYQNEVKTNAQFREVLSKS